MKVRTGFAIRAGILFSSCFFTAGQSAEIKKLPNTVNLNTGGSWVGNVVPTANDVMLWDSLVTGTYSPDTALPDLAANLAVEGLKVTQVGGTRHLDASVIGFENPGSAHTLTLGIKGIDLSTATQTLFMQSRVTIGASQPWIIGDANTALKPANFDNFEDLAFQAMAANTPFNFGGNTVTTTGDGDITITSGYTLSNGTLDVGGETLCVIQGGTSRVTNIASSLNLKVSSGRLRLQSNSGVSGVSLVSAAPVTVNGGTFEIRNQNKDFSLTQSGPITLNAGGSMSYRVNSAGATTTSGNITVAGDATLLMSGSGNPANATPITGNLSGSGNLSYQNTCTSGDTPKPQCRFSGNNNGYSGTITINGSTTVPDLRLTSNTAGSSNATWRVNDSDDTLEIDGVSVQLGRLEGAGTVTNSHSSNAATLNIGSGNFSGTISDGSNTTAVTKVDNGQPGGGTFIMGLGSFDAYSGNTVVNGGTLLVNSSLSGTIQVNASGTLGGTGQLSGTTTVTGTVAPGASVGELFSDGTMTFGPGSRLAIEIGNWTGDDPGADWDHLDVGALILTATPANKLVIRVSGAPQNFSETGKTFVIADSFGENIAGFNAAAIAPVDSSGFVGAGTWAVQQAGNGYQLLLVYTAGAVTPYGSWASSNGLTPLTNNLASDPDGDGHSNRVEFALDGSPLSAGASGKLVGKVGTVGGVQVLTITLPVRSTAAFTGGNEKTLTVDGVTYRIQASDDLSLWNLVVTEVTGTDATNLRNSLNLPALSVGWTYRTFRSPGPVAGDPSEFLRVLVE